ncbi:hypothetical protein AJ88_01650 [Mesorhizobium amorphae CCBAU 01583]|nr:hypothetical protein AJ88_01650 [Mesorhizobium amorphae CCBAU 01583]
MFDLVIDSKLRGCDLVKIKIGSLIVGPEIRTRAIETDPLTTLGVADLNLQIEVGNLTFSARAFGSALA